MSVRWRIAGQSDICPILDRYVSDKISVRLNADGQNDIGPMSFTISSRYTRDIGPMMARYRFADWVASLRLTSSSSEHLHLVQHVGPIGTK